MQRRHVALMLEWAVIAVLATGTFAHASHANLGQALFFGDPTEVNLLERWNHDGTYALGLTATSESGGPALGTVDYSTPGQSWRVNTPHLFTGGLTIRHTFTEPMTLGRASVTWRDANHSPSNYTLRDQSGDIVVNTAGGFSGTISHTFAPRVSNYLEMHVNPANTAVSIFEVVHMGAYLAAGQKLAIDGSYNIMYEEDTLFTKTGYNDSGLWTDHVPGSNGLKPSTTANSITYELSRTYRLFGAMVTQFDTSRFLADAKLQVSVDGVNFTTVYDDADDAWRFRTEAAPRDKGYMVLDAPFAGHPYARFVRLSWGDNANPVEISEFQVFGFVPEPSSALLLCAGAALALRRHRR